MYQHMNEVLHFQITPAEEHFNWDREMDLPGCWTVVMRKGRAILTDV